METRIAILGIIVEDLQATTQVNDLLHENGSYIIGRMGIPYREKNLNLITVAMDAPANKINTLAGKLGKIQGVSVKTMYSPAAKERE